MSCSGGIGWSGYLKVCNYVLPFLNGSLVKVTDTPVSNSIVGGGYENLTTAPVNPVWRDQTNFVIGKQTVGGAISTEVFGGSGNFANAFKEMIKRTIGDEYANGNDMTYVCNGFSNTCKLIYSPGGGSEIVLPVSGRKALISSMTINGNNGGNVGASFNIMSAGADWNTPPTGNTPATSDLAFETAGFADDSNPVPWYAANFTLTNSGETFDVSQYVTEFSFTVNNNVKDLYFFNGINYPGDLALGRREITGSFSYYSPTGQYVELLTHGAKIVMTFGHIQVTIPFVVFGAAPVPNGGPNEVVVRNVSFRGVAKSATEPSIYWTAV